MGRERASAGHVRLTWGTVTALGLLVALGGCATTPAGPSPVPTSADPTAATADPTPADPPPTGADPTATGADPVPQGSGCDPGGTALPDGRWFGEVAEVTADSVTFDLACWFIGEDAVVAAEQDGAESPPPNDYYVRNESPQLREVPVGDDVVVVLYPTGDPASEQTGDVTDLLTVAEARGGYPYGVWLDVADGAVVGLQEQWVP